jgi:ABC-2 type transport system ATP-binding protein
LIQAEHLTKRYGQHIAINDLNFSIEKGEVLGFLGPNGAGKSTAMNIITGYISASEGRVLVEGQDILEFPLEVKKKIGYLPENPPLYPDMIVTDFLRFSGELKHLTKSEMGDNIDRVLNLVKLEEVKGRMIRNLSKGFQQRVGLAQALIGNPQLLILDEPTVGLDPEQMIDIRNLIKTLGQDHTIVLSSHILPEVSAVCDRVLIINRGEIVAVDTPDNLSKRLLGRNRLTVRVAGEEKEIASAFDGLPKLKKISIDTSSEKGTFDVTVEAEKDADIRRDIFKALAGANLPILLMRPMDLTLEDIFLQLTTSEKGGE